MIIEILIRAIVYKYWIGNKRKLKVSKVNLNDCTLCIRDS